MCGFNEATDLNGLEMCQAQRKRLINAVRASEVMVCSGCWADKFIRFIYLVKSYSAGADFTTQRL